MGIDLDNLATDQAVAAFTFMGQDAKVTYRPLAITTEALENIDKQADKDNADGFIEFIVDTVVDLDIKNGKKKVPINAQSLKSLPLLLLRAVYRGIMADNGPGSAGEAEGHSNAG